MFNFKTVMSMYKSFLSLLTANIIGLSFQIQSDFMQKGQ